MMVRTLLSELRINPDNLKDFQKFGLVANIFADHGFEEKWKMNFNQNESLHIFCNDNKFVCNLRIYETGLVTTTLEYSIEPDSTETILKEKFKALHKDLQAKFKGFNLYTLPSIKRGDEIYPYFTFADGRIVEMDLDKKLFDEISLYQRVQICHSKQFGNILLLDELQNLADSDVIYTETLMQKGKISYSGKEVLILGGGDGNLLWEILKENPKFVIMVEVRVFFDKNNLPIKDMILKIDEIVIKACQNYLRKLCGNCLDEYHTFNKSILIADAVPTMKNFINQNRQFDYIFGDFTDVPIQTSDEKKDICKFFSNILHLVTKLLKPDGKYMQHINGVSAEDSLKQFLSLLKSLETPLEFSTCQAFVPSFMENWIFCQVWLKGY